ncbi:MAG: hypothetical protein ACO1O1_06610 [Adhaeribacter sp.]
MNKENKDQDKKNTQHAAESLKNKTPEQQAKFAQGGQPAGHSQGGQGGNQLPHEGRNPRHDQGDELSEFAREDS